MLCRNTTCGHEIEERNYCPLCGYANGHLGLIPGSNPSINKFDKVGEISLGLGNVLPYDVDADVSVEDASGVFSLGSRASFCVQPKGKEEIIIKYELSDSEGRKQIDFILTVESNDGIDEISHPKRTPEVLKLYRKEQYTISVNVTESGSIEFEKGLLTFGNDCKVHEVKVFRSSGTSKISIESIDAPNDFTFRNSDGSMIDYSKMSDMELKAEEPLVFSVEYHGDFDSNINEHITLSYSSDGNATDINLPLFVVRKTRFWPEDQEFPNYIVAIDFGTSKTTVAYIKTDNLFDEIDGTLLPIKDVDIAELDKRIVGDSKRDVSSRIVYDRQQYLLGFRAEMNKAGYSLDYLKMRLQDKEVEFRDAMGKTVRVETEDVLTNYLCILKSSLPKEIRESDSNIYVFTLPVLDSEKDDPVKYNKQMEVTLNCAKNAGFGDESNIKVLTESDAAMFYIINSIEQKSLSIPQQLEPGDIIGVFDYGAGTLDISFGKYSLLDGVASINVIYSEGLFGESGDVSLGGNSIDDSLGIASLQRQLVEDEGAPKDMSITFEPDAIFSEDGVLSKFENIGYDSRCYPGTDSESFFRGKVKPTKEQHSFWGSLNDVLLIDEKNLYAGDEPISVMPEDNTLIPLPPDIFTDIVKKAFSAIMGRLRKGLPESGIKSIKYMFMVGGSSLIKDLDKELYDGLFQYQTEKVFSPYEYAGFSDLVDANDNDELRKNCIPLREAAVYAVAKGAALSVITKMDKSFQFGLEIRKIDSTDKPLITFTKGDPHPSRLIQKKIQRSRANGTWGVYAKLEDGSERMVDSFTIKESAEIIRFSMNMSGRYFELSCSVIANNAMKDVRTGHLKKVEFMV